MVSAPPLLAFLAAGSLAAAVCFAGEAEPSVSGIRAFCRDGQVFVTWKDAAEGEAGAAYRYTIYRSDIPITQETLAQAEAVIRGILNNSCKLAGMDLAPADRLNPVHPRIRLADGGEPLPLWSGLGVHTVTRDGAGYYAVVATDHGLKPLSRVVPGQSATLEPVAERMGAVQPIRQIAAAGRPNKAGQIGGKRGLPLYVTLHASCSSKAWLPNSGDCLAYFGPGRDCGWRAGQPGVFALAEQGGEHPRLLLSPRDTMPGPDGRGAIENLWFGLWCRPNWADDQEPRAHPFAERRVDWMLAWTVATHGVDTNRIYLGGQSMGAYGTLNIGLHRPGLFAALYPTGPKCRMNKINGIKDGRSTYVNLTGPTYEKKPTPASLVNSGGKPVLLPDGQSDYFDRYNMVAAVEQARGELPFVCFIGGRNGGKDWSGVDLWGDTVPMVHALMKGRHGFAFGWDNGNHGSAKQQFRKLCEYYPWHRFALNLSYPAFSNSSLDDDIGPDGPKEGFINFGFVWSDPVDEAGRWEATISNREAGRDITVDVTPRRCQRFKVRPGERCRWSSSAGGAGEVVADDRGVLTVERLLVPRGMEVTLAIRPAADPAAAPFGLPPAP